MFFLRFLFFLRILLADKIFWLNSLSIWGIIWSVAEGGLFALQLAKIATDTTLGYFLLILLALSLIASGYINWPLRELDEKLQDPVQFKELSKQSDFFTKYQKQKDLLEELMKEWEGDQLKLEEMK